MLKNRFDGSILDDIKHAVPVCVIHLVITIAYCEISNWFDVHVQFHCLEVRVNHDQRMI